MHVGRDWQGNRTPKRRRSTANLWLTSLRVGYSWICSSSCQPFIEAALANKKSSLLLQQEMVITVCRSQTLFKFGNGTSRQTAPRLLRGYEMLWLRSTPIRTRHHYQALRSQKECHRWWTWKHSWTQRYMNAEIEASPWKAASGYRKRLLVSSKFTYFFPLTSTVYYKGVHLFSVGVTR